MRTTHEESEVLQTENEEIYATVTDTSEEVFEEKANETESENEADEEQKTECEDDSESENVISEKDDNDFVDTDSDDEFVESITDKKLSPEQAKKKIAFWTNSIKQAEERLVQLEPIHQVYINNGLNPVMEEVKKSLRNDLEDEKVKEIKDTAKVIESIHVVNKLIANLNSDYIQNKRDIEKYQSEIERIGSIQLDIFEDTNPNDDSENESPSTQDGSGMDGEAA